MSICISQVCGWLRLASSVTLRMRRRNASIMNTKSSIARMKSNFSVILIMLCAAILVAVFVNKFSIIENDSSNSPAAKITRPSNIQLPQELDVFQGVLVSDELGDPAPGGLRVRATVLRTNHVIRDADCVALGGVSNDPNDRTIGRLLKIKGSSLGVVDENTYWYGSKSYKEMIVSFYGGKLKDSEQSIVVIVCAPKG